MYFYILMDSEWVDLNKISGLANVSVMQECSIQGLILFCFDVIQTPDHPKPSTLLPRRKFIPVPLNILENVIHLFLVISHRRN